MADKDLWYGNPLPKTSSKVHRLDNESDLLKINIPEDGDVALINKTKTWFTFDSNDVNGLTAPNILTPGSWVQISGGFGKVLQVVSLTSPDMRYYYNVSTTVFVPGLSTIITPKSSNSKFLVFIDIFGAFSYVFSANLTVRGVPVGNVPTNKSSVTSIGTEYSTPHTVGHMRHISMSISVDNTSLTPAEIKVGVTKGWYGGSYAFYLNDRFQNDMRSLSRAIIMEVDNA